tara:strand:+ start:675 stop:1499 length:825 start_codon:yes stop_codon:yes gene_type:complete
MTSKKLTLQDFSHSKNQQHKLSMLTCYDYTFAQILNQSDINILLVGDSGAMTQQGYPNTTHATIEMMCTMTQAVAAGAPDKFIVADMPFLTHKQGIEHATQCAAQLIRSGAHALKIEGLAGHEHIIKHLIESGLPVMGHLGLTPQSVHSQGYQVQGQEEHQAQLILDQALILQSIGCFSLVLECVPNTLAQDITQTLHIPTIGIGAGSEVDGQVLVLQDMLGMTTDFKPKFVRHFLEGFSLIHTACNTFHQAIQTHDYPSTQESYFTTEQTGTT